MSGKKICILFYFFLLLVCSGCEKPVARFDTEPIKKRIVLNGSLGTDIPFSIHISSSKESVGVQLIDFISDADVRVTENNSDVLIPQYDSMGFYIANWYPEQNRNYEIQVTAPGFDPVSVEVAIPEAVSSTHLLKDQTEIKYPYSLSIDDPADKRNTYILRAWCQNRVFRHLYYEVNNRGYWINDTIVFKKDVFLSSPDELIEYCFDGDSNGDEFPVSGEKGSTGFVISDELFNGKIHEITFKISYFGTLDMERPYLFTELLSVNRNLCNFLRSYILFYKAQQMPFAEPVAIMSNVKNGLGFVYGYSVHTDSVRIK